MSAPTESSPDVASPPGTHEIKRWVDAYVKGGCSATTLNRSLTALCRDHPGAASDALLLLTQYDEEGHLRLRNLEVLRTRLESVAKGESSESLDAAGLADVTHTRASTELLPVVDTAPATVLLPTPAVAPITGIMPGAGRTPEPLPPTSGRAMPSRAQERPTLVGLATRSPRAPARKTIGPGNVLRERYVLEDALGSGGMGTVYRALDRNRLDLAYEHRHVALKILREEFARRPEAIAALRREFLQAQSLTHPGLVKVFDFDRDGDTHFITMELIDGELLSSLIARLQPGRLPRPDALRILEALGDAVTHAHEHGVLHLDLKPGNVMITSQGEVRVLDFGLAHPHVREPWISDGPPAFHAATPTYASCERITGTSPDARDDVFSLACIAYELLSGEHPFNRSSAREAREEGAKARRIRGLPRRQWQALSRGLAWAREDRTRTVAELLEDLGIAGTTRAVPARPRRANTGSPTASFVGGMLVALVLAGAWVAYLQREQWRPLLSEKIAALETAFTETWNGAAPAKTGISPVSADAEPTPAPATAQPDSSPERNLQVASTAESELDGPAAVGPPHPSPETPSGRAGLTPPTDATLVVAAPDTEPASGRTPIGTETSPDPAPAASVTTAPNAPPTETVTPAPAAPRKRGRVQLAADSVTVGESERVARIKVRRVGGSDGRLPFLWRTGGDSAVGDEDFAETGWNEVVLAPGQSGTTLTVPIVADQQREHTELFEVVLGSAEDDTVLGAITTTTVILVDDD